MDLYSNLSGRRLNTVSFHSQLVLLSVPCAYRSIPQAGFILIFSDNQCFPTLFPRARFQQGLDLQQTYNKLYCAVAEDEEWIYNALKDLIPIEPLASVLWGIYQASKKAGPPAQNISMGIFRSDYMLHTDKSDLSVPSSIPEESLLAATLKQVELNTFSCAGATHANKVVDMHRYLARTGAYDVGNGLLDIASFPTNDNTVSLANSLRLAHDAYGPPKSGRATQTAVLFVVQPRNVRGAAHISHRNAI